MVLAGTHYGLMLFLSITLSWCVFSRDYCISGQLKSNISLGITKTVSVVLLYKIKREKITTNLHSMYKTAFTCTLCIHTNFVHGAKWKHEKL